VKDVDDICTTATPAVVDEVISCWETEKAACRVWDTLAAAWKFAEQPEPISDAIEYAVCAVRACMGGPVFENFLEILARGVRNAVRHYFT
jgi:hypothetical protein